MDHRLLNIKLINSLLGLFLLSFSFSSCTNYSSHKLNEGSLNTTDLNFNSVAPDHLTSMPDQYKPYSSNGILNLNFFTSLQVPGLDSILYSKKQSFSFDIDSSAIHWYYENNKNQDSIITVSGCIALKKFHRSSQSDYFIVGCYVQGSRYFGILSTCDNQIVNLVLIGKRYREDNYNYIGLTIDENDIVHSVNHSFYEDSPASMENLIQILSDGKTKILSNNLTSSWPITYKDYINYRDTLNKVCPSVSLSKTFLSLYKEHLEIKEDVELDIQNFKSTLEPHEVPLYFLDTLKLTHYPKISFSNNKSSCPFPERAFSLAKFKMPINGSYYAVLNSTTNQNVSYSVVVYQSFCNYAPCIFSMLITFNSEGTIIQKKILTRSFSDGNTTFEGKINLKELNRLQVLSSIWEHDGSHLIDKELHKPYFTETTEFYISNAGEITKK